MNKWLHKFMEKPDISDKPDKPDISDNTDKRYGNLENMPGGGPDKPDRLDPSLNVSGLSGSPGALLGENLSKMPKIAPDISDNTDKPDISDKLDKLGLNLNLSGLSGPPWGLLGEKVENNPRKRGDKSARFKFEPNLSPLSLRSQELFPETEKNGATTVLTELTRDHQSAVSVPPEGLFPLDRDSLLYDFEERLAIAEYDGDQTPLHANRIAYLDAFISVLTALPALASERDWLDQRIQTSFAWLEAQEEFRTIN